jgi:methylated-DNA-[protein]-cysteine S-methyltransferase
MNSRMDMESLLTAGVDDVDVARLRAAIARRAADEELLDVAYRTLDSPVGPLLLAATPAGLVRVAFTIVEEPDAVLEALAGAVSPRVLEAPARLDPVARELDEYFAGRRRAFDQRAVRAVGTACALNPVPLVIPCHRVVRSDGAPGAYRGGADAKLRLLALESAA